MARAGLGKFLKRDVKMLRKLMGVIAIVAFISSLLFFKSITGNVIGTSNSNYSLLGIILLFTTLIFGAAWLWLRGKQENVI